MKIAVVLCLVAAATICSATDVRKCKGGLRKLESQEVSITGCKTGNCKLKRKTKVEINLNVTPEKDINQLTTNVHAIILNIPLPFIGVDGTDACDKMYSEDGTKKVGCPLKAGQKYLYKNSFPVEEFYPPANLIVHWALSSQKKDVVCFEVPARII